MQSAVIALVVYVEPDKEPPQLPPTASISNPLSAFNVKAAVLFSNTSWDEDGLIDPPAPAVDVTVWVI